MGLMEKLLAPAAEQHGYVTTDDAAEVGVPKVELRKLAQRGHLEKVAHGVYRVKAFPRTAHDELMRAALWPAGRGVIARDTALMLWDLADVNPTKIDIAVPAPYRPRRRGGDRYRVWVEELDPHDIDYVDGIPVVTPERAIVQAARSGLPRRFVEQAIQNARRRGLFGKETEARVRDQIAA